MTQKQKELLLKDLCARLPYGVIGEYSWKKREPHNRELTGDLFDELTLSWDGAENSEFLPYLRPMSSMTESERKEFDDFCVIDEDVWMGNHKVGFPKQARIMSKCVDWLNKKMFDFRGLIPKGLALSTDKFNPYKD